MKIFAIVLVILIILIALISLLLILKINSEYKEKAQQTINDIFALHGFELDCIYIISKKLIIALNRQFNRVAVVEDYNPDDIQSCNYKEIKASNIINIEHNGFILKLNYRIQGQVHTLTVTTISKEAQQFFHGLLEKILLI